MFGRLLEVIYPRSCAGCRAGAWPFCESCQRSVVVPEPPWCLRCGFPMGRNLERCPECPAHITWSRAAFVYQGPARSAILRLKFGGDRWVAEALGRAMVSTVDLPGIEAVSWVPTTSARRAKRGFDQAEVLANVVARALRLPRLALLKRTRGASGPQARRGGAERRIAMRGSFRLTGRPVPGTVLLVDDVFTTGATASECARTLREGGASRVGVITAARSLGAKVSTGPGTGLWLPGGSSSGSRCQPRAKRPT